PLRRRGARERAGIAVRRRLERRAGAAAPRCPEAAAVRRARARAACLAPGARPAAAARFPAALRPARRGVFAALARAALRAGGRRARLRPRRTGGLERPSPLREPAQARAARALVRGAARPGRRGL